MPEVIETFKFTKEVPLVDADGKPIRIGSVLAHVSDGQRGVVTEIGRPGHRSAIPIMEVGDIIIQRGHGTYRGTNCYGEWRHIPHNDQTYWERYRSWFLQPYNHDEDSGIDKGEGLAINGILALLRDDVVNEDYGPWPDHIENALELLVEHLTELKGQNP